VDVKIKKEKNKYEIGCPNCGLYDDELFDFYRDKFCDGCKHTYYTIVSKDDIEVNLILIDSENKD
jgi:Zn finger protein HypA/HybF involved in hydrogenase expression